MKLFTVPLARNPMRSPSIWQNDAPWQLDIPVETVIVNTLKESTAKPGISHGTRSGPCPCLN